MEVKKIRTICRRLLVTVLVLITLVSPCLALTASADMPYDTYSYNYYGEDVAQPHVYTYEGQLSFSNEPLRNPQDMFVQDGVFYIADTGNSRIVKTNEKQEILLILDSAENSEDKLNKPQGVFVTEEGHIYVADSGNSRIVEYDAKGNYIRSIGRPVTDLIDPSTNYTPQKVVVDHDGRIYVTAYGINMGLLEFSAEGNFQSFMGAAKVTVSPFEYIWKNYFSTAEQRARMATIVPTEYSNIFVDEENFIYATINNLSAEAAMAGGDMIRRLNPTGDDILRRLGNDPIQGDLYKSEDGKFSSFVDVTATSYGCYFLLDNANGKVFGYDYDGNSLFAFGRNGNREGNVQNAVAIGITSDASKLYILDYQLGGILVFRVTEYGNYLLSALHLNSIGDSEGSIAAWREVLRLNSNSEFAYTGLGKNYLAEGEYKTAMEYFKNGNNKKYYSKALYYYRKELMEENFGTMMALLAVAVAIPVGISEIGKFNRWREKVKWIMSEK